MRLPFSHGVCQPVCGWPVSDCGRVCCIFCLPLTALRMACVAPSQACTRSRTSTSCWSCCRGRLRTTCASQPSYAPAQRAWGPRSTIACASTQQPLFEVRVTSRPSNSLQPTADEQTQLNPSGSSVCCCGTGSSLLRSIGCRFGKAALDELMATTWNNSQPRAARHRRDCSLPSAGLRLSRGAAHDPQQPSAVRWLRINVTILAMRFLGWLAAVRRLLVQRVQLDDGPMLSLSSARPRAHNRHVFVTSPRTFALGSAVTQCYA